MVVEGLLKQGSMSALGQVASAAHAEDTPGFYTPFPVFSVCVYRGGC